MPQAEALNLLAITLMLGMSPPNTSGATQAVSAQRPGLEAMQVRDHMLDQDRLRAVMPTETTKITAPSADPVVPAVVTVVPATR